MQAQEEHEMGRFSVEFEVANYHDMAVADVGKLPKSKVRRTRILGVVDPGATRLLLPASVADKIGLARKGRTRVRYADGRLGWRDLVPGVWLSIGGRESIHVAIVEPRRTTALIGVIVLEDLDLLVDSKLQQLVPRDPKGILSEVEESKG
jgi:predicted aspartyl protease